MGFIKKILQCSPWCNKQSIIVFLEANWAQLAVIEQGEGAQVVYLAQEQVAEDNLELVILAMLKEAEKILLEDSLEVVWLLGEQWAQIEELHLLPLQGEELEKALAWEAGQLQAFGGAPVYYGYTKEGGGAIGLAPEELVKSLCGLIHKWRSLPVNCLVAFAQEMEPLPLQREVFTEEELAAAKDYEYFLRLAAGAVESKLPALGPRKKGTSPALAYIAAILLLALGLGLAYEGVKYGLYTQAVAKEQQAVATLAGWGARQQQLLQQQKQVEALEKQLAKVQQPSLALALEQLGRLTPRSCGLELIEQLEGGLQLKGSAIHMEGLRAFLKELGQVYREARLVETKEREGLIYYKIFLGGRHE